MDKLADIFKIFFDKYFIPAVVSTPISILVLTKVPNIFSNSESNNEELYNIFVFCVVFLIVLITHKAFKKICTKIEDLKARNQHRKFVDEENLIQLEKLWSFVDTLSISDKKALFIFLRTDNATFESNETFFGDSIFNNSYIMHKTIVEIKQEEPWNITLPPEKDLNVMHFIMQSTSLSVKGYRLKDEFFAILKYSFEKYKRISHFEDDNKYKEA